MAKEDAASTPPPPRSGSWIKDVVAALVVLGFGVATWIGAGNFPESPTASGVGPGLWPQFTAAVLVGLASLLLVKTLWGKTVEVNASPINQSQWLPLILVLGTLVVYLSIWPIVGFFPTTLAAILLMSKTLGLTQWRRAALWSLGVTIGVWILFDQLLTVPL